MQPMHDLPLHVRHDAWLSRVMRREAYVLEVDEDLVQSDALPDILSRLEKERRKASDFAPLFLSTKLPTTALHLLAYVERHGFRLTDTNIVLGKPMGNLGREPGEGGDGEKADDGMGYAAQADAEQVIELARKGFSRTRFHLDPCIDNDVADEIAASWAGNFFLGGRGDRMVVCRRGGRVLGFALLLHRGEVLSIDLIAVRQDARGSGVGKRLVAFIESVGGFSELRVGTQVANIPALGFYQSVGMRIVECAYIFHYHGRASHLCWPSDEHQPT